MNDIKTGGLVFPQTNRIKETYMDEGGYARQRSISLNLGGISVRDYFAAAALQGLISAARGLDGIVNYSETVIAENAYALADAMLKAREND